MGSFSGWVLSIAGITILSVVIDLLLPKGSTAKYIKAIFAFIIVLVIISPLPKLIGKDFNLDRIIDSDNIEIQDEFIFSLNRDRLDDLQNDIEKDLDERGIKGVKIMISANIFTTDMKIEAVFVDLFDLFITEENAHINTNEAIVNAIQEKIKIGKENIVFNE